MRAVGLWLWCCLSWAGCKNAIKYAWALFTLEILQVGRRMYTWVRVWQCLSLCVCLGLSRLQNTTNMLHSACNTRQLAWEIQWTRNIHMQQYVAVQESVAFVLGNAFASLYFDGRIKRIKCWTFHISLFIYANCLQHTTQTKHIMPRWIINSSHSSRITLRLRASVCIWLKQEQRFASMQTRTLLISSHYHTGLFNSRSTATAALKVLMITGAELVVNMNS